MGGCGASARADLNAAARRVHRHRWRPATGRVAVSSPNGRCGRETGRHASTYLAGSDDSISHARVSPAVQLASRRLRIRGRSAARCRDVSTTASCVQACAVCSAQARSSDARAAASSFGIPAPRAASREGRAERLARRRRRRRRAAGNSARPVTDLGSDAAPALVQPAEHACTRLRPVPRSGLRATALSDQQAANLPSVQAVTFASVLRDACRAIDLGVLTRLHLSGACVGTRRSLIDASRSAAARRSSPCPPGSPRFAPPAAPDRDCPSIRYVAAADQWASRDAGLERNGPQRERRDRLVCCVGQRRAHMAQRGHQRASVVQAHGLGQPFFDRDELLAAGILRRNSTSRTGNTRMG